MLVRHIHLLWRILALFYDSVTKRPPLLRALFKLVTGECVMTL